MEYAEHKFYPGSTFALFKISVTFVCCGLITIAQSYAQAADEEEKTIAAPSSCKEVLFVSVPVLAYLEPLVYVSSIAVKFYAILLCIGQIQISMPLTFTSIF